MILEHSAKPAEDLQDSRSIRFFFRGDTDLVPCLVSWEALDRLESEKAASRAERLARFEKHRPAIEAAALHKFAEGNPSGAPMTVEADDVLQAAKDQE